MLSKAAFDPPKIVLTSFFVLQLFVGYLLMLSTMTYSVEMFFAVLLGLGAGHHWLCKDPLSLGDRLDFCCPDEEGPAPRRVAGGTGWPSSASVDERSRLLGGGNHPQTERPVGERGTSSTENGSISGDGFTRKV